MSALQRLAIANVAVAVVDDTKEQIKNLQTFLLYKAKRNHRRIKAAVQKMNALELSARYVVASHIAGDQQAWLQHVKRVH
jgi:hypothetical protein